MRLKPASALDGQARAAIKNILASASCGAGGRHLGQRGLAARTADTAAEMIAAARGATSNLHLTPISQFPVTPHSPGKRADTKLYAQPVVSTIFVA